MSLKAFAPPEGSLPARDRPPGRYEVHLREEVLGPSVSPEATAFKAEDMVQRTTHLGEVEIRAGETARFEATVEPEEKAR
ncbi:MAG TPA: hypothetical protein VMT52_18455 [Planctomycetota bacterium]|nr:hypothetical protein [Planctomycetota bacterium]